nr:hypothetical protein HK105_004624 [Polyrhizophydium stewartii]
MARIFHGLRIDNCHSTPIHVAQYLLDAARRINPDLYVFAELFTGSEEKDVLFVSKLGINSLIREAMNAWDPQELSRVVHRQGGSPVGSFTIPAEYYPYDILGHSINSVFYEPLDEESSVVVELRGSRPHSLLMDCTHDNETPHQKRTAEDSLPNAAVVAMAACAVGSVKGYDEIVPELLNVVTESRKYRLPDSFEGIIPAKSILNTLHAKMAREGYSEIHVNQEHDFISIHRVHPITHDGYLLIVRCAFRGANKSGPVHSPIILRNQAVHVLESATLSVQTSGGIGHASIPYVHDHGSDSETEELMPPSTPTQLYHAFNSEEFEQALERSRASIERRHSRKVLGYISGLPSTLEFSTVLSHITHAFVETVGDSGDIQTVISIDSQHFVPGSIVLYRTWVVGTGIEQDVAAAESASPSASPVGSQSPPNRRSQAHNGLTIETTKNPAGEIDVSTLTLDLAQLTTEPSEPAGAFERLWQLLGMNQHNAAIEMMVRFGYGVLGSSELWYTSQNSNWMPGLYEAVRNLSDRDINTVLFRAAPEEVDMTGDSVYDVPGHGALAYCGLQGIVSALLPAARDNDLGAALFQNLRQGPWLADYVVGRLTKLSKFLPGILPIRDWLQARLKLVTSLSQAFVPKYFAIVVVAAYQGVRYRALTLRSDSLSHRNLAYLRTSSLELFAENCVLTQFQLFSSVRSTGLFPVPYPLDVYGPTRIEIPKDQRHPSLAAGLPHFSTQHMRCWGRDIFIALRGMFLIPGNYAAARSHIIAFGSTLRHGLIPNLLDQGIRPRYNARDATWFWLRSVRDYCRYAPEGYAFLGTPVARRFIPKRRYTPGPDFCVAPDDPSVDPPDADTYIEPSDPRVYTHTCTIAHLCQEILERHARGISFREWNAGPGLDHAMRSEGFDIAISTPWATASPDRGFVHGGNRWNCGTWMDKMGDSQKAGTRGVPATPRDGSPVEIIGLLKGILHWLSGDVHVKGKEWWKWSGVKVSVNGQERPVEYAEWDALVGKSFETLFYIPLDPAEDKRHLIERPELVSRRGIYKDVLGSSIAYADYQLRPNACIAMVLAPEMFDPDHARHALTIIRETLAGIKTLDPKDWAYRGVYDNGNDSADPTVAHGFNYHQGPEWVWVMGYFLRAYIHFFTKAPGHNPAATERELMWVQRQLLRHKKHICDTRTNPFAGLPELTNENGAFCYGSCPTQAWSTAVMVEVIQDLMQHRIC